MQIAISIPNDFWLRGVAQTKESLLKLLLNRLSKPISFIELLSMIENQMLKWQKLS